MGLKSKQKRKWEEKINKNWITLLILQKVY